MPASFCLTTPHSISGSKTYTCPNVLKFDSINKDPQCVLHYFKEKLPLLSLECNTKGKFIYIDKDFNFEIAYPFNKIYQWLEDNTCEECIEYIVSIMMEPFGQITQPLIKKN